MTAKTEPGTKNRKPTRRPTFDLENPELPSAIADKALASGGYPYAEKMKGKVYKRRLAELQLELLKLQSHIQAKGERLVIVFEGRDASGKGSCISRFLERLNPRHARHYSGRAWRDGGGTMKNSLSRIACACSLR
jgi:polyphosphate kinase 2 (PPK2 family)